MAHRISNGLELSKQSWAALRHHPQLIVFPVISLAGMIALTVLFFIPVALLGAPSFVSDDSPGPVGLAVLFVYYLITYTVVIFSNTALVGATMRLIEGKEATVTHGLRIATARLGKILVYAFISATVGIIARSVSRSGRGSNNTVLSLLALVLGGLIQGAWNLLVFFAIPVLVVEDVSVTDSLKRSLELFKQTWGESFTGRVAIGALSCLAYVAVIGVSGGLIALGVVAGLIPLVIVGAVALVLGIALVALLNGAVNGVFQASLYRFATTGDAGPFIDSDLAREAFLTG